MCELQNVRIILQYPWFTVVAARHADMLVFVHSYGKIWAHPQLREGFGDRGGCQLRPYEISRKSIFFLRFVRSLSGLKLQKQQNIFSQKWWFLNWRTLWKSNFRVCLKMPKIKRIYNIFSYFSSFLTRDFLFPFFGNQKFTGCVRCKSHFLKV